MKLYMFSTGYIPVLGRLLRNDKALKLVKMPMVCFLIEDTHGLTLIDTGFGRMTLKNPADFPGRFYSMVLSLQMKAGEDALSRIEALGYKAGDVKDIILTHLHIDHVGGIPDFPDANIHTTREEYAAMKERTDKMLSFYHSGAFQHGPKWIIHKLKKEERFGFSSSLDVFGDGKIILVATPGHTSGHISVIISMQNRTVLHLGDAAMYEDHFMNPAVSSVGTKIFRWMSNTASGVEKETRGILVDILRNHPYMTTICSHDSWAFERLSRYPDPF